MRAIAWVAALALAGCGGQSEEAQEALAEAERANNRASDLEVELAALRDDLENETANRQAETSNLESDVQNLESEVQNLSNRVPY